jgi:hypothetical protein
MDFQGVRRRARQEARPWNPRKASGLPPEPVSDPLCLPAPLLDHSFAPWNSIMQACLEACLYLQGLINKQSSQRLLRHAVGWGRQARGSAGMDLPGKCKHKTTRNEISMRFQLLLERVRGRARSSREHRIARGLPP